MRNLKTSFTMLLLFGTMVLVQGQNDHSIALAGQVVDAQSGEGLPLVHLLMPDKRITTITDESGYFTILLPPGQLLLQASHVAYDPVSLDLKLTRDTTLTIRLTRRNVSIDQVSVHGSRIQVLTPETYFHVSDFEVTANGLFILGHPKKNARRNIYCARLDGTTTDTIPIPPSGYLEKDFMDGIWYLDKDSAYLVSQSNSGFGFSDSISAEQYYTFIDPIKLLWGDKIYFQNHPPDDNCLNTYYQKLGSDSIFLFSTLRDSVIMRLTDWRAKDHFTRQISDLAPSRIPISVRSHIIKLASNVKDDGELQSKKQSSYISSNFTEPLIYGSGSTTRSQVTIQDLAFITAPVFHLHNLLVQIDFYNGYMYFFRPTGILIHQVPIDFHIDNRLEGSFRKIFHPLVDVTNDQLYVWVQRMDNVDVLKIDLESGTVIQTVNLESYKNVHNLRIAGGYLFFLYNELQYPYATRLFRMKL